MKKFNDKLALRGTLIFGSMWTTYAFFCYGFLPIMFPKYMNTFLYWSNTIQLWSLPLIMVGQSLLGKNSEKQSQETHDTVMQELAELKEILEILKNK